MEWENILYKARLIKERFLRSYKCVNTDRDTKQETVNKHINVLVEQLEILRVLFNVNYHRLTQSHKTFADSFYYDIREKLLTVAARKKVKIEIPQSLHEPIIFSPLEETTDFKPIPTPGKMPQTLVEFLNTASRLLPDFDGNSENLQSFIDAINLVDSIKETHESVAINLIKTKLKGTARNLISTESTLGQIISKLKTTVKGESVDVINAKLMSTRQSGKNVNAYAKEIEELTKKLETAYIRDGLPHETANKYATHSAVTAITKNSSNDRVKLIMQSGTFGNMNEVLAKFISGCTEAYGRENTILSYGLNRQGYNNNRGRNGNQNRSWTQHRNQNFGQTQNRNFNRNNNSGGNPNNNSGSNRSNYDNRNRNNNSNRNRNINVATTEQNSENE